MTENFEFGDVKKVRKSLLIVSLIGLFTKQVISFSESDTIEIIGLKVNEVDNNFLPNFIGGIIIFYVIVLLIRYFDDRFRQGYQDSLNKLSSENFLGNFVMPTAGSQMREAAITDFVNSKKRKKTFYDWLIIFLDIIFPIGFALIVILNIYFDIFNLHFC